MHSLAGVIAYNEANRETMMPYFGQELMHDALQKGSSTDASYLKSLHERIQHFGKMGIDAAVAKHKLDAILSPSGGTAWLTDLINGDHFGGGGCSAPAAVATRSSPQSCGGR